MAFAVKIGLMTQEEAESAQAAGDVKECFAEADEKIISCFVTNLGTEVFEQMKAGKMPYDLAIVEKMRKAKTCMKQYSDEATDQLGNFLKLLPAADSCIATELGPDFIGRLRRMAVPCSQMKGIRGKMEACFLKGTNALFEPCAQKECGQVQGCMLEVSKPLMSIAKRVEAGDPVKREFPKVIADKLNSCGIDPNFDPNTCIQKSTCTEFFSCLNPSGSQQSQGDQPGEMPPELKKRMDSCQKEIIDIKMRECTNKPTCGEVNVCLKAQQQGDPSESDKGKDKKMELPPDVESKIMSCQKEEIQAKLDVCIAKSCSEFDACIKALQQGGVKQDGQQQQDEPDPKLKTKIQACADEKINACIAKPCDEFNSCLSALQQGGGGGGEQGKQQQGQSNSDISAKMQSCQPKGGGDGGLPVGGGQQGGGPPQGLEGCSQQGGIWNGSQCDFSKKGGGITDADECTRQKGNWDGTKCNFPVPTSGQYPQASGGSSYEIPITPEICANFTNIPACSYVGSPDSQNYQLCKQCFPNK